MTLKHRLTSFGNRIGVWLFRASDGRLSGSRKNPVLLITTPGRRTGIPRSTCVRFLDTADGYVVWGTAGGAAQDPDWFRNLRAATVADLQIGPERLQAYPHELVGVARDRVWTDLVLVRAPGVAKYTRRTARTIPVAVLRPISAGGPPEPP